jgi:tetratricopeptide (TPR) repeat protein
MEPPLAETCAPNGRSGRGMAILCVALAASVVATYANHFENGFHFDDIHTVTDNPLIRDLGNIPRFFTDAATFSVLSDHATYRPLVSTSLALDYRLAGGTKPFWFHLSTMVWFLVQLVLMFFLFRRIMQWADRHPSNTATALLATALYGLHPANAETVNYVIQRGDLYCTLGVVASLLCFAAYPAQRKYAWYCLPAIAAILSKAPALIFPLLLLAYVFLFEHEGRQARDRRGWARCLRTTAPAFIVAAFGAVLTFAMTPASYNAGAASGRLYRATQPWAAAHYFKSFFLPTELSTDTDRSYVSNVFGIEALLGFAFVAALLAAAYVASRKRETKPIAFGIIWFITALLPTSLMPLAEVVNDHRMFFPFVGLALAAPWSLRLLLFRATARLTVRPAWVRASLLLTVAALAAAAAGTRERNMVWRNDESLWRDVTIKSPRNGRGLMNYGLVLMERRDYTAALGYFERALLYSPNYFYLEINLGIANGGLRRDGEAERHFLRALSLAPDQGGPFYYYGRWLNSMGRLSEAVLQLETALRNNRMYFAARYLLLQIYSQRGDRAAVERIALETLQIAPKDETARQYLFGRPVSLPPLVAVPTGDSPERLLEFSLQFYRQGRFPECIETARKALQLRPDYAEAYNNIAAAYNAMKRWDEGMQAASEAVRLKPDFQLARNNLAWALQQKKLGGY